MEGVEREYGLNTADGVNMVVLMVTDTLRQNVGHGVTAIDGDNAFNTMKRQKIYDRLSELYGAGKVSSKGT